MMIRFIFEKYRCFPKWIYFVCFVWFVLVCNTYDTYAVSSVSYFEFILIQTNGGVLGTKLLLAFFLPICFLCLPDQVTETEQRWLQTKQNFRWIVSNLIYIFIISVSIILLFMLCALFVYLMYTGIFSASFANQFSTAISGCNYVPVGSLYLSLFVNLLCLSLFLTSISLIVYIVNLATKSLWGGVIPCQLLYWWILLKAYHMFAPEGTHLLYIQLLFNEFFGSVCWLILIIILAIYLFRYVCIEKNKLKLMSNTIINHSTSIKKRYAIIGLIVSLINICLTHLVYFRMELIDGHSTLLAGINLLTMIVFSSNYLVFANMGSFLVTLSCLPVVMQRSFQEPDSPVKNRSLIKKLSVCGLIGGSIFICAYVLLFLGCIIYSGRLYLPEAIQINLFRDLTAISHFNSLAVLVLNSFLYGFVFGSLAYLLSRFMQPQYRPSLLILLPLIEMARPYVVSLFNAPNIGLLLPTNMIELPGGIFLWQRLLNFGILFVVIGVLYAILKYRERKNYNVDKKMEKAQ